MVRDLMLLCHIALISRNHLGYTLPPKEYAMRSIQRRDFIKKTALAVTIPTIWTGRSALGAAADGTSAKNDQILIGSIGLGAAPAGIGYQVGNGAYKNLPPNPKMRDMRGCDIARQAQHFGKTVATCDADISRAERFKSCTPMTRLPIKIIVRCSIGRISTRSRSVRRTTGTSRSRSRRCSRARTFTVKSR